MIDEGSAMNKYVLNKGTGTLHLLNGCYCSKILKVDKLFVFFNAYDEVRFKSPYKKDCMLCFKGK